jgi:hypothetical protein
MKEEMKRLRIEAEDSKMQVAEMENLLTKQQRKSKIVKAALIRSQSIVA